MTNESNERTIANSRIDSLLRVFRRSALFHALSMTTHATLVCNM